MDAQTIINILTAPDAPMSVVWVDNATNGLVSVRPAIRECCTLTEHVELTWFGASGLTSRIYGPGHATDVLASNLLVAGDAYTLTHEPDTCTNPACN